MIRKVSALGRYPFDGPARARIRAEVEFLMGYAKQQWPIYALRIDVVAFSDGSGPSVLFAARLATAAPLE